MKNSALLVLLASFAAPAGAQESARLEPPRMTFAVMAGRGLFRGGTPEGLLGSAVRFQPDVGAGTLAGTLSFRLARPLFVDLDVARARGPITDGADTPDNVFLTAGLRVPFPLGGGRLVPYLTAGGGIVDRQPQDGFQRTVERALAVGQTDPAGYAGAGFDLRFTRLLGLRADYRYLRLFPDGVDDLALPRDAYGVHRLTGGFLVAF
jgi:hypothetical protein